MSDTSLDARPLQWARWSLALWSLRCSLGCGWLSTNRVGRVVGSPFIEEVEREPDLEERVRLEWILLHIVYVHRAFCRL
jgi:hypothetical protein